LVRPGAVDVGVPVGLTVMVPGGEVDGVLDGVPGADVDGLLLDGLLTVPDVDGPVGEVEAVDAGSVARSPGHERPAVGVPGAPGVGAGALGVVPGVGCDVDGAGETGRTGPVGRFAGSNGERAPGTAPAIQLTAATAAILAAARRIRGAERGARDGCSALSWVSWARRSWSGSRAGMSARRPGTCSLLLTLLPPSDGSSVCRW